MVVDQLNLVRTEPEINMTKMGLLTTTAGPDAHIVQTPLSARSCDLGSADGISFYAGKGL